MQEVSLQRDTGIPYGAEHAKEMQSCGEAGARADLIPHNSLLSSLPFLEVLIFLN